MNLLCITCCRSIRSKTKKKKKNRTRANLQCKFQLPAPKEKKKTEADVCLRLGLLVLGSRLWSPSWTSWQHQRVVHCLYCKHMALCVMVKVGGPGGLSLSPPESPCNPVSALSPPSYSTTFSPPITQNPNWPTKFTRSIANVVIIIILIPCLLSLNHDGYKRRLDTSRKYWISTSKWDMGSQGSGNSRWVVFDDYAFMEDIPVPPLLDPTAFASPTWSPHLSFPASTSLRYPIFIFSLIDWFLFFSRYLTCFGLSSCFPCVLLLLKKKQLLSLVLFLFLFRVL